MKERSDALVAIWDDGILLEKPPVLVDVGASGEPPASWKTLSPHSVFVGFDPDLRAVRETTTGEFRREIMVNEAIVQDEATQKARLFLTKSPYCSSTLRPDVRGLSHFLFSDLFEVVRETEVPATTLNQVIRRFDLRNIDWLKLDTQGTDLRLFQSLETDMQSRVLALDIEPGLIDAYEGEDLFTDAHAKLVEAGFWLARLNVQETARMQRSTLKYILSEQSDLRLEDITRCMPKSPGWVEALYLRTVESLQEHAADRRDYVLLWMFALIANQIGFAFDIVAVFAHKFPGDSLLSVLNAESSARLRATIAHGQSSPRREWRASLKAMLVPRIWLKK